MYIYIHNKTKYYKSRRLGEGNCSWNTVCKYRFVTQTWNWLGICIFAVPALALREILLITVLGPGLSTSTSTLARNSSAEPKESRNNFMSSKSKQVCQQQRPFLWMYISHFSYSSILPYSCSDNNRSSLTTPATLFSSLGVSQDLI